MTTTADRLTDAARDILLRYPHLTPSAAYAEALRRDPALAREHHQGGGPDPAERRAEPETRDPGLLLQEHAARHRVSFAEACRARPELFAAWNRAESVAVRAPGPVGHDPNHAAGRVHFDQLSQAERRRHSPWLRRLAPGETVPAGATLVEKFGPVGAGGGSFVLEGA